MGKPGWPVGEAQSLLTAVSSRHIASALGGLRNARQGQRQDLTL